MSSSVASAGSGSHEQPLSDRTADLLHWLGVPAFAGPAAVWKAGRILPLIWMLAFELGVLAALKEISVWSLMVAAPIIALSAFVTLPISAGILGRGSTGRRWWLAPVLTVIPVTAFFVIRDTALPLRESESAWFWPHYWSDAVLTLAVLYLTMIILLPPAQASSGPRLRALWVLLVSMAVVNVLSVTAYPNIWTVGEVSRHTSFLPMLVAATALTVALRLGKPAEPEDGHREQSYVVTGPIAVLVVLFGLTNVLLVYVVEQTVLTVVTVLLSVLMVLAAMTMGRPTCEAIASGAELIPGQLIEPRLRIWIPAFLLTYPLLSAAFLDQRVVVFDQSCTGWAVVGALLAFNLVYLLVVWVLVSSGLDHLIAWSSMEFWRKMSDTLRRMGAAAPLLLIGVTFFVLTAEVWQVAYALPHSSLLGLFAIQVGLLLVLVVGWSVPRVQRLHNFPSWDEVGAQITGGRRHLRDREGGTEWIAVTDELRRAVDGRCAADSRPSATVRPTTWVNALFLVLMYQFFVIAVIVVLLFLMFFLLAWLAVSPDVAAEWIFGDGQGFRGGELLLLAPVDSPWVRVPAFLTLFSSLYFAAHSLRSMESRIQYFTEVDSAIRFRFAVRLGYRLVRSMEQGRTAPSAGEPAGAGPAGRGPADPGEGLPAPV